MLSHLDPALSDAGVYRELRVPSKAIDGVVSDSDPYVEVRGMLGVFLESVYVTPEIERVATSVRHRTSERRFGRQVMNARRRVVDFPGGDSDAAQQCLVGRGVLWQTEHHGGYCGFLHLFAGCRDL